MAEPEKQENTSHRRTEILDAEYIPRTEVPNVPRVHSAPPSPVSPIAVLTVLIALLAIGVAVTRGGGALPNGRHKPVELTQEARLPAAALRPSATEAPVPRGEATLGVAVETVRPPVAVYYTMKDCPMVPGAQVFALDEDGPAAAAGVQSGDVITAVGDQAILTAGDLERAEARGRAGDVLELTVFRAGEYVTLEVALAPRSPEPETGFFHTVEGD